MNRKLQQVHAHLPRRNNSQQIGENGQCFHHDHYCKKVRSGVALKLKTCNAAQPSHKAEGCVPTLSRESRGRPGKQCYQAHQSFNLGGTAPGRKGAEAFLLVESRLVHQRQSQHMLEISNHLKPRNGNLQRGDLATKVLAGAGSGFPQRGVDVSGLPSFGVCLYTDMHF